MTLVHMGKSVSPDPFPLWTWNLYHRTQQELMFIKTCSSTVTPIAIGAVNLRSKPYFMFLCALVICVTIFREPYNLWG